MRYSISIKGGRKFVSKSKGLKYFIFNCTDGEQAGLFEANMKRVLICISCKCDMGILVRTMADSLNTVKVSEPEESRKSK
jgi:hypothetical protein